MRQLAHLTFALALAVTQGGIALADDSASNDTTGSDSQNHNEINNTNNVSVNVSNDAEINASFWISANTGGNNITDNTTVGDISTGNASGDVDFDASISQSGPSAADIAALSMPMGGDAHLSNHLTGSDSNNTNEVNNENNVDVRISNRARANVDFRCEADTGENDVRDNTTVEDISTGDASCEADVDIAINQGGVGGDEEEENGEENGVGGQPTRPGVGGQPAGQVAGAAAVGAGLFAAGSSLLILLAMLFIAANAAYLLRRKYSFAIHSLNEGKVEKKH